MARRTGGLILKIIGTSNAAGNARRVGGSNVTVVGEKYLRTRVTGNVPAQGTAGTAQASAVDEAPFAGTVTAVGIIPHATITGVATNNRKFALVNKGQSGTGTTEIASITFGNGTNATGFDRKALTLSATAADLVVAEGDVLALVETINGTGLTHSGARVVVEVAPS